MYLPALDPACDGEQRKERSEERVQKQEVANMLESGKNAYHMRPLTASGRMINSMGRESSKMPRGHDGRPGCSPKKRSVRIVDALTSGTNHENGRQ